MIRPKISGKLTGLFFLYFQQQGLTKENTLLISEVEYLKSLLVNKRSMYNIQCSFNEKWN
jgi:hypothetical protein